MVTLVNFKAYFCMAKHGMRYCLALVVGSLLAGLAAVVSAQPAEAGPQRPLVRVPRVIGRLQAPELGLVINTADPYSVEVGEHYRRARHIPDVHVLRIELPVQPRLSPPDLERLRRRIDEQFDGGVQALALAWTQPYAVECQSITSAVTLGFDPQLCNQPCGRRAASPLFNSATSAPFKDLGLRPSMLLASSDVERARKLIDRGVASDYTLGLVGAAPVQAHFMTTADTVRSVRSVLFPPAGLQRRIGLDNRMGEGDLPRDTSRVVLVQTGVAQFQGADTIDWVPGALADHLTSFGGQLDRTGGQSTVLDWLDAGATASYGTVSEPCNHLQKFPHPQILLLHYLQGSTALEAYWKSVAWPQQGVFVGEPLAAPFARQ
jgi:uncharacterized protein (TIGR03790 family)